MKKSIVALTVLLAFGATAAEFQKRDNVFIENAANHAITIYDWDNAENSASTFPHAYKFTHSYKLNTSGVLPQKFKPVDLGLSSLVVSDIEGDINLETFLRERLKNHSLVVIKGEKILHEHYWNNMTQRSTHLDMSVTKSFTSLAAQKAVDAGKLDMSKKVIDYLPELKGTAWETATVQEVSDMRTSVIQQVSAHKSWDDRMTISQSYNSDTGLKDYPNGVSDYFPLVTEFNYSMGETYTYQCVNTEVLGKIVEKVTGENLADIIEVIFQDVGAENDAYLMSDHAGGAVASGGLNAGTKDLARVGAMLLNDGKNYQGKQVISPAFIDSLFDGNELVRSAWAKGKEAALADGWYKDQFRLLNVDGHEILAMVGIHGQVVAMERSTGTVIAMNGGYPQTETPRMAISIFHKAIPAILKAAASK
ncbi:serine hydrolase domain-containing protein [Shewanella woodyi]|uniref:serine hydrolase domain-containing protein n=1 Tax=Shewanella woodyi TaxID=60961 RepID=UPI00374853FC